ncbi:ribonuclease P protein component [bacterium LRH843]|nr:ribonuclease P protein component [bacterium LRH843]
MKKKQRIKKSEEFSRVFKQGHSVANRQFVLYVCKKDGQEQFRLGLSVNKRVGNAVTRNRVKRYIREVFQAKKDQLTPDVDYVVIARKPTADMNLIEVEQSLLHIMRKARVLKKKG